MSELRLTKTVFVKKNFDKSINSECGRRHQKGAPKTFWRKLMTTFLKLLILAEVLQILRIKKTKLYGDIQRGVFPPPLKFDTASRWPEDEVAEILQARLRGASEAELVLLVNDLVARRKA